LIPAGWLVDRIGTRGAVLTGTGISVVALTVAAVIDSAVAIFFALLVSGIGSAVIPVGGTGALFRVYGPERRGWALGVRQTAVPLGGIAGAAVLPLLVHAGGTDLVFGVAAVFVGVTGVWFAFVAPHEHVPARAGLAVRTMWRTPGMRRLVLVAACYIVVLQAVLVYLVPTVRDAGLSALVAGTAYVVLNVTAVVARIAWGRVADRHGGTRRVRTLVDVGLVAAGGAVVFTLALHAGPVAALLGTVVFGVGALGWNAVVYVTAGELVRPELAGQSFAFVGTAVFLLPALAAPPAGALAEAAGWDVLWLTTGAFALLGAYVASGLGRTRPSPASGLSTNAPETRTPDSAPSRGR
jgi:MFS family permease